MPPISSPRKSSKTATKKPIKINVSKKNQKVPLNDFILPHDQKNGLVIITNETDAAFLDEAQKALLEKRKRLYNSTSFEKNNENTVNNNYRRVVGSGLLTTPLYL